MIRFYEYRTNYIQFCYTTHILASRLTNRLEVACREKLFPGYAIAYLSPAEQFIATGGHYTYEPDSRPVQTDSLFDIASLTKVISPMLVASALIEKNIISLNTPVHTLVPEYASEPWKQAVTVHHLLTYSVSFDTATRNKALLPQKTAAEIMRTNLTFPLLAPPGSQYLYSNLTAILLSTVLERVTGATLPELTKQYVLDPLGLSRTTFTPLPASFIPTPPTEVTPERGMVQNVTHDELSYYLERGGHYGGAAGLFSTITDQATFLQACLQNFTDQGKPVVSESLREAWTANQFPEIDTPTPLIWGDINNHLLKNRPKHIVKGGFTGCFLMADLEKKRGFVLLSNRTYPQRQMDSTQFEALKHDLIALCL